MTIRRRITVRTTEPDTSRQVTVEKQRRVTVAKSVRYSAPDVPAAALVDPVDTFNNALTS